MTDMLTESDEDYVPVDYSRNYETQPMSKGETIAVIGTLVTLGVGFIAFVRYMIKEDNRIAAERKLELETKEAARKAEVDQFNEWCDEQPGNGKVIVKPQVGTYIAIPVEAYKDVEIKRLPGITY